jgi:hypothetical protein
MIALTCRSVAHLLAGAGSMLGVALGEVREGYRMYRLVVFIVDAQGLR